MSPSYWVKTTFRLIDIVGLFPKKCLKDKQRGFSVFVIKDRWFPRRIRNTWLRVVSLSWTFLKEAWSDFYYSLKVFLDIRAKKKANNFSNPWQIFNWNTFSLEDTRTRKMWQIVLVNEILKLSLYSRYLHPSSDYN